jgi:predicted NUDIX family NTP pyrophosphohydrolase
VPKQSAGILPYRFVGGAVEVLLVHPGGPHSRFLARGHLISLTPHKQPGSKLVHVWALQGDWDPRLIRSNSFSIEWPPRSGQRQEFPEVDRAEWFRLSEATRRILPGQAPFPDELEARISRPGRAERS